MGIRGVDYEDLLRNYLRHLIHAYGEDYFDEALHLADAHPELNALDIAAFQVLVNEVAEERIAGTRTLRHGLC